MKIMIYCCLCDARHETQIDLPADWQHHYDALEDEQNGFCPQHASVAEFATYQCSGCVSGWGDCPMWSAFSHSHGRDIGPDDYTAIESGICPRRVNGTLSVYAGKIDDIDLSNRAPVESGVAFAQAIRDYCAKYP